MTKKKYLAEHPLVAKLFELHRYDDHTGVSGTGVVAQGVEFGNGKCVVQWLGKWDSTVVHKSIKQVIHLHGHGGMTKIVWLKAVESEMVHDDEAKTEDIEHE